ncbi:hypothetical protein CHINAEXTREME_03765 [Halobiforma lacisalsi AJ5]|uniref:Uncharacterized protein n=1 Tax=Natronobacterium lacisalsi AJ5 TaxID=358396 RepID=M0LQC3_NATLA|nr:hypothetical protein [Halobiforma lacisalsi]APW96939.1 hypothetical protein CHINAEXTREME_03765 [Halobiforma lacisalsi AJ5]EMA34649.1 hypothetical protein C445_07005 [Halobiforma lacisalsi AJ5]
MTTFTTDDIGKTVESASGDPLGTIVEVDDGTAYVEPDPDVRDSSKAALDWEGSHEAIPLADSAVTEITADAVRLESAFPEGSLEPSDVAGGGIDDPDAPEPTRADDEFYDDPAEGPRVDPSDRMEQPDDREGADRTPIEADRDAVETTASRELEVDPTELTDGEPGSNIRVTEDVGDRTDADANAGDARPEDGGRTTDEPSGQTPEDAGSIDAEMPAASERGPEAETDDEEGEATDDGEEHDLDEGR